MQRCWNKCAVGFLAGAILATEAPRQADGAPTPQASASSAEAQAAEKPNIQSQAWGPQEKEDARFANLGFGDEPFGDEVGSGGGLLVRVLAGSAKRRWLLQLQNVSPEAIVVNTDPRLLTFQVAVPGREKEVECRLPSNMFPNWVNDDFVQVMKPGERVSQRFDPRLYCFNTTAQSTLVAGAIVTPQFGWAKGQPNARRFVVASPAMPLKGKSRHAAVENLIDPLAQLTGRAFALNSSYAAWSTSRPPSQTAPDCDPPEPRFSLTAGSDVNFGRDALVAMRMDNPCDESLQYFFLRTLVGFRVRGPDGDVACLAETSVTPPIPSEFSRLRPKRGRAYTTRILEMCPIGTFDRPGVYRIAAAYHGDADGQEYGMDAFTGKVRSERPVLIRVRKGNGELFFPKRPRPMTPRQKRQRPAATP